MPSRRGKYFNSGVFFMLAALFVMLGIIESRGYLAIGITFLIIALASIGRPPMRLLDDLEERVSRAGDEKSAEEQPDGD